MDKIIKLFSVFCFIALFAASCETEPIIELSQTSFSFSDQGSNQTISFSSNKDWSASVSGGTWCSISPASGSSEVKSLTVTVTANDTYDDRSATITIKAEELTKVITISQPKNKAILLTKDRYEVGTAGGSISAELRSNIEYDVSIPIENQSWIINTTTKGLVTSNLIFAILENFTANKRQGKVIIKEKIGQLSDTIIIDQNGGKYIDVKQSVFSISSKKNTIEVEVLSNIDFDILLSASNTWIKQLSIRKDGNKSIIPFIIESNNTYMSRNAEITFFEKLGEISNKTTVIQSQNDTIIIAKKSYDINTQGGDLTVSILNNIDFDISIPSETNWVTLKKTESNNVTNGLKNSSAQFTIANYNGDNSRSAKIKIFNSAKNISEYITINQSGGKDVYWGDYTISSITDMSSFKQAGYKKIVGNLNINAISGVIDLQNMGISLKEVTGSIYINGENLRTLNGLNSLTSVGFLTINKYSGDYLTGLDNLERIENNFELLNQCRPLRSFKGLNKLKFIGGSFKLIGDVYDFHEIQSFEGLNNLETIGKDFILNAEFTFLKSFDGLNNLRSIGGDLKLSKASRTAYFSFDELINFKGLNSLERIGGSLLLWGSFNKLVSFEGLEKLTYIGGSLFGKNYASGDYESYNSLESFKGLDNLKTLGGGIIMGTDQYSSFNGLKSFEGLNNLEVIGSIYLMATQKSFSSLTSFSGLDNVKEIKGNIDIQGLSNNKLSFNGLENLNIVGGHLYLILMPYLTSLSGFDNLREVKQFIEIYECERLNNISALRALSAVDANGGDYLRGLIIKNCPRLFDFCSLTNLLNSFTGIFTLSGNGYNPTIEQIKNGQCKL